MDKLVTPFRSQPTLSCRPMSNDTAHRYQCFRQRRSAERAPSRPSATAPSLMIALGSPRGLAQIAAIRRIVARTPTASRCLEALGWRIPLDLGSGPHHHSGSNREGAPTGSAADPAIMGRCSPLVSAQNDPLACPAPKTLPTLWRRIACQPNEARASGTRSSRMLELWSGSKTRRPRPAHEENK